jgi:hypothetical protein
VRKPVAHPDLLMTAKLMLTGPDKACLLVFIEKSDTKVQQISFL